MDLATVLERAEAEHDEKRGVRHPAQHPHAVVLHEIDRPEDVPDGED